MLSSLLSLICHLTRRSSRLVPDPIKTRQTNYIWHRNNSVCSSLETSCLALHQILWRSNIHRTVVFWQQIANKSGGESGLTFYSGWITAFCFWGKDGKCKYQLPSSRLNNSKSLEHSWDDDWSSRYLRLDEIIYHQVQSNKVTSQFSSVAVKVDDNGAFLILSLLLARWECTVVVVGVRWLREERVWYNWHADWVVDIWSKERGHKIARGKQKTCQECSCEVYVDFSLSRS